MRAIDATMLALRANSELGGRGGRDMPTGRTALQKIVYLVSLRTGVETTYYAHYYGPFSEGVSMGIARLWGQGHIHEDPPTRDSPGYTYSLTEEGERAGAALAGGANARGYAVIVSTVRICRDFCALRHPELGYASKIRYIMDSKNTPQASVGYLMDVGRRAGWEMSEGDVRGALELLRRLGVGRPGEAPAPGAGGGTAAPARAAPG